tara:strand:+ start:6854 stop:9175 length:2322 start_codon:yes stop_codon:yes gene_type:complete
MIFSSKAETLEKFSKKNLKYSSVPKIIFFTEKDFYNHPKKVLKRIKTFFKTPIAIRSSCLAEDSKKNSMAGYFYSSLNIEPADGIEVKKEIINVINSYSSYKNTKNIILIQEMVKNVAYSGVIMTCEKTTHAPYYIIDYVKGKDTASVTAGKNSNNITFNYFIHSPKKTLSKIESIIIKFIKEIINKCENKYIDIEFAIDNKNKVHLLQVRPIVNVIKENISESKEMAISLFKLSKKIEKLQKPHHSLLGKSTAFGTMPDWNPAEMIGIHPKPLALSLYQELITNTVWANQRRSYGFRDLSSNQLMTTFLGTPFIDIRVDFNSWIPNDLPEKLSEKLVNFYINKYKKNTELHDKVEFDIIYTCFNFGTKDRLWELGKHNFSKNEIYQIMESLKSVTHKAFQEFGKDTKSLKKLTSNFDKVINSEMYIIDKIYWLVEDCKKYGTLAFAGLARCGFIAVDILNSIERQGIISQEEKLKFFSSIHTVTSEMSMDIFKLNKKPFIAKYGHLRPSTYDITSMNYSEGYDKYFQEGNNKSLKKNSFNFTKKQIDEIDKLLQKYKLKTDAKKLIKFIKESIKSREYAKYLFSKNLDAILNLIKELAIRNKISIVDISYIEIQKILYQYYNLSNSSLKEIFENDIIINKKNYDFNKRIKLPHNIIETSNVYYFSETISNGNFIGTKDITGKIIYLNKVTKQSLNNKIVFIESADPGYDFVFTRKIRGLITKFGGANSHMAIRCAELNIPAAIGIGEKAFEKLKDKSSIRLNCKIKKIDLIV